MRKLEFNQLGRKAPLAGAVAVAADGPRLAVPPPAEAARPAVATGRPPADQDAASAAGSPKP